ncbi:ribokinase [Macrococcus equi]|uniref:ribokinase n=1 Tax=Macrococcus equi TaxID=3395462 RepID=UPI0039BE3A77
MKNIYVIGSMSVDLVVQAQKMPKKGETILGEQFFTTCGGKGANQAVAAARLGGQVKMVGAVGNDAYGEMIINNLQANHVDTSKINITDSASGTAHITLAENDNSIVVVPSANQLITTEQVDALFKEITEPGIILIQNEIPVHVIQHTIQNAPSDAIIIYNPAPFIEIDQTLLDRVDYFTPNETESSSMFGADYTEAIQQYPEKMIVTLGSQGAVYYDNELIEVPTKQVEVVDTTGAGDTFNGALAVALSEGKMLSEAIQFANQAASLSVQGIGAQGGMPMREEMI